MKIMDAAQVFRTYKIPIILGSASAFLIVLSIILFIKSYQVNEPIRFSSASMSANIESALMIDVEGAVVSPGMYKLPAGSRVEDAIAAAGGLSADADTELIAKIINRAGKLIDGGKLFLPNRTSASTIPAVAGTSATLGISINEASLSQLDTLPGVGPVTAKKIIDNRPYQALEELVSKKVLSPALYDKLKDQLSL